MHSTRTLIALFSILLLAAACGEDDASSDPPASGETRSLTLTFDGLPVLGADFVYEGWIIVDDAPVTTGRFTVDASGALSPSSFDIPAEQANAAAMFVLTIEPATGDDPAPSDVHVLAGPFEGDEAGLTIDHPAALATGFEDAAGTFILATPTTADVAEDDNQGIWFLDPNTGMSSLTLPELPAGWIYEGWVVDTSGNSPAPISTGTFDAAGGADSDAGGPTAGPDGAPAVPGQDFIDPARDLTSDHLAVITVEPVPDDSPMPFQLKPLVGEIGADIGGANPQTIGNAIDGNTIGGAAFLD